MSISIELTAIIGGSVMFIIWLSRLEFKGLQNSKDIELLRNNHDILSESLRNELTSMNKTLSKIEGFMLREKKESL